MAERLQPIAPDVWLAEGPDVRFLGVLPYPTRMALVRLASGDLWVWSPVALDPTLREEVTALGRVRHLVAPNKLHHLYLGEWRDAFPEARLWSPPGLAKKRPDLRFDAPLEDVPPPEWGGDIDQVVFRGSFFMDEVVFLHRASRTAFFTDLLQKFDPASLAGWRGWLMRADGLVGPEGSTPREWRASWWNRAAGRAALRRTLEWRPERLVIAHGEWVRERGEESLARSLAWLA